MPCHDTEFLGPNTQFRRQLNGEAKASTECFSTLLGGSGPDAVGQRPTMVEPPDGCNLHDLLLHQRFVHRNVTGFSETLSVHQVEQSEQPGPLIILEQGSDKRHDAVREKPTQVLTVSRNPLLLRGFQLLNVTCAFGEDHDITGLR